MSRTSRLCAVALTLVLAAQPAAAQHAERTALRFEPRTHELHASHLMRDWTDANEFSMEPYVGVFLDGMVEDNTREMGPLMGVRLAWEPVFRLRLLADFGYAEVNGVGAVTAGTSTFTYGNDWIFTMAGAEFDVVPGNTVGMITLAGGVAWRKTEPERRVLGTDDEPDLGGFSSMALITPGVALAHALSGRAAVRFSIQDFIVDVDEDPEHSPGFSLGVVFR